MRRHVGRHFLQIPGPTNVPDSVLKAIATPTIDHRSAEFAELLQSIDGPLRRLFDTAGPVVIYSSSGTGAWEAALTNTLSPGDVVLAFDSGHFATLWRELAERLGLRVQLVPASWRRGVDPAEVHESLAADRTHRIKAVMVVHNETSTGVTSRIDEIRRAIDAAGHPALLLVDTISSLGSIEYHHDAWGVDVTVAGSQKGMMLPPGLAFNAVSERALAASTTARLPRSYWDWQSVISANRSGAFPATPSTNLLYGLREALQRLEWEGHDAVLARHARHARATRSAVEAWGLQLWCEEPREYSNSLTAVLLDEPHDADAVRQIILDRFDMSLGAGLGRLKGRVFRIGHLGDLNDLTLLGALCGVEMGLALAGCAVRQSGVAAAMEELAAA
jgi:alanine-glyoxylate transaminase / serine-glyoxylate transaminase / serine-pyruvate transaminase